MTWVRRMALPFCAASLRHEQAISSCPWGVVPPLDFGHQLLHMLIHLEHSFCNKLQGGQCAKLEPNLWDGRAVEAAPDLRSRRSLPDPNQAVQGSELTQANLSILQLLH